MKLLVYTSADAPPHMRACAVYLDGNKALPVIHYGPSPESVTAAAERWWVTEAAKAAARNVPRTRKGKAPPPEDVGDVI